MLFDRVIFVKKLTRIIFAFISLQDKRFNIFVRFSDERQAERDASAERDFLARDSRSALASRI